MATLVQRLTDLATRVATECKSIRTLLNGNQSDLSALNTTAKNSIVASLNELKAGLDAAATRAAQGAKINDVSTDSTTETYSVFKIRDLVSSSINALTAGAPGALDTLDELAAALGDDANFAANITAALSNRVRTDVANQGLTAQQRQNARTNIDAYGSTEIGDPDTNYVTTFNSGLV